VEDDADSWGDASGVKHAAEVIEVQLTDQLLILHAMLDDAATSDGASPQRPSRSALRPRLSSCLFA
jgi:hypothetical protein